MSSEASAEGSGWGLSAKCGLKLDAELSMKYSFEDIDRLYVETKDTVEWQGGKFTPKSMSLSRINMNTLRDTQTLEDRSVRVSYSTAILSVALNFRPYSDEPSMDQLFFLQSQIKGIHLFYIRVPLKKINGKHYICDYSARRSSKGNYPTETSGKPDAERLHRLQNNGSYTKRFLHGQRRH